MDANLQHVHEHHHDHDHHHDHAQEAPASKEEQLALLAYMIHHNEHHAEELHELGHSIGGETEERIHEAVALFDAGNAKLEEALKLLKGED